MQPSNWVIGLPERPTTRFAPSPTGFLHLGHVAHALWVWGVARYSGGKVVLRIEDHDRDRCRPEYEAQILADLEWLGLEPDADSVGSLRSDERSRFRQSDSDGDYTAAVAALSRVTQVYGCTCSRSRIAQDADMGQLQEGHEVPYSGRCREAGIGPAPGVVIRAKLPDISVSFTDLRLGAQLQTPAEQCGDLAIADLRGNWTYQFAVAVDDRRHGIDLIIRGEDLLESTGRQLLLGELLGRESPARLLHHPLIRDEHGRKLNKRDRALSLAAMRAGGMTAGEVKRLAAARSALPREFVME